MISATEFVETGASLYDQGDFEGAYKNYVSAIELDPNLTVAYANLGVALSALNQLEASEACLRRVIALCPHDGNQWNNFGNILMRRFKYTDAMSAFANASQFCPENSATWHNLALCSSRLGDYSGALEYLSRAIALGADDPNTNNTRALTLLYDGLDLASAFEANEVRWELMPHSEAWDFHIPEWKGEPLAGRNILVHSEQGYGDAIMGSRFIDDLVQMGANVTFAVLRGMKRLFDAQYWDIEVIELSDLTPARAKDFDFHSPLFSVMRWLKVERDAIKGLPYLASPVIVTPAVPVDKINVGLCWASGTRGGEADWRRRVAPLEDFLDLASLPNIMLHSLQVGPNSADIERIYASALITDHTPHFIDWADTAAFIEKLDLVISVDTAVAHLSAALGKPTWMLSQHMHCWRWWGIKFGTGWPWYNEMRILRQTNPFDWKDIAVACRIWLAEELWTTSLVYSRLTEGTHHGYLDSSNGRCSHDLHCY